MIRHRCDEGRIRAKARGQHMGRPPAIPARARFGEYLTGHRGKSERVVEFAMGEQTGIGCEDRPSKLERQFAVEIEPENAIG
jgi:hypothetical protein